MGPARGGRPDRPPAHKPLAPRAGWHTVAGLRGSMRVRLARLYARASLVSLPALVCLVLVVHQQDDSQMYHEISKPTPYHHNKSRLLEYAQDLKPTQSIISEEVKSTYARHLESNKFSNHEPLYSQMESEVVSHANVSSGRAEVCSDDRPPLAFRPEHTFQEIYPGRSYVFSAYLDLRGPQSLVRVVGISDFHHDGHPRWCRLWYRDRKLRPEVVRVRDDIVPETHGTR